MSWQVPWRGGAGIMAAESRAGRDPQDGELPLTRMHSLAALLLLVLVGACERTPAPVMDRSIEHGTALPPPGLGEAPRR
jgi:hypothetical protein